MKYYTYKVTFKDLPGYFYYGKHKCNGKVYLGSPVTWAHLWLCFEPEIQILQWYKTAKEAEVAERSIINATWGDRYSLNEHNGNCFSEETCSKNGKKTGAVNGKKTAGAMNGHPNTIVARSENGKRNIRATNENLGAEKRKKNAQAAAKKLWEGLDGDKRSEQTRLGNEASVKSVSKAIVGVDPQGVEHAFKSSSEAARQLSGVSRRGISRCCVGERVTHKGWKWRFEG